MVPMIEAPTRFFTRMVFAYLGWWSKINILSNRMHETKMCWDLIIKYFVIVHEIIISLWNAVRRWSQQTPGTCMSKFLLLKGQCPVRKKKVLIVISDTKYIFVNYVLHFLVADVLYIDFMKLYSCIRLYTSVYVRHQKNLISNENNGSWWTIAFSCNISNQAEPVRWLVVIMTSLWRHHLYYSGI